MSDSFVVEANHRVVGVAVRCRGGYEFHASDPEFRALDHIRFPRARSLTHRISEFARRLTQAGNRGETKAWSGRSDAIGSETAPGPVLH